MSQLKALPTVADTRCKMCEYRPIAFDPKLKAWVHLRGTVRRIDCSAAKGSDVGSKAVPQPHYQDDRITVYLGDPMHYLPILADASVDLVVTQPPAGMGAVGLELVWRQCLRALRPGGYLIRFDQRLPMDAAGCGMAGYETSEMPPADDDVLQPVDFMACLLQLTVPSGALVLDPFAGDGAVAEAALRENTNAVLVERDPDLLPAILERLKRPVQTALDFS